MSSISGSSSRIIIQAPSRILSRNRASVFAGSKSQQQQRRALAITATKSTALRRRYCSAASSSNSNSYLAPSSLSSNLLRRSLHASSRRTAMSAAETDALAAQNAEAMQITPDSLGATLKEKIGATHCEIEDMSGGCGQAFGAIIVSPQFEKKNTLARHRLVNGALKQEIAAIHAWTPKCFTPEEWEKKKAS